MAACQKLPGVKQGISFEPYLYGSPYGQEGYYMYSLTVSNVTFEGDIFVAQTSFTIAGEASLCNFDMQEPLAIHFQNGASAFGGDFSSMLWPYNTSNFTATITVEGGDTFSFSCAPGPGSTFFGFIETLPFQDLTFSDGAALVHVAGGPLHEELIGGLFMVEQAPPALLTSLSRLSDGSVQFVLKGSVGVTYTVDTSTNLVTWTPLATLLATNNAMPVLDAAAANLSRRFYRAVAQ
jgi:hypothetical protein